MIGLIYTTLVAALWYAIGIGGVLLYQYITFDDRAKQKHRGYIARMRIYATIMGTMLIMTILDTINYADLSNTRVDVTGTSRATACDGFPYFECYCDRNLCYSYQSLSSINNIIARWVYPILLGLLPAIVMAAAYYFTRTIKKGHRSNEAVSYTSAIGIGSIIGYAIFGLLIAGLGIWQWRYTRIDPTSGFVVWGGVPVPMWLFLIYVVFFIFPLAFLECSRDLTIAVLALLVAWALAAGVWGSMSAFYLYGVLLPTVALFDCRTMYYKIKPKGGKTMNNNGGIGNLFG